MEVGVSRAWAYVEEGALPSSDLEIMSSGELLSGLEGSINVSRGINAILPVTGQAWPNIQCVYPFRDYCEYEYNGHRYRQPYAINAERHVVVCGGTAVAIQNKFVQADALNDGIHTGNAKESMQRVQTGVRYAYAPPRAQLQSFSTGGATSELVTQIVRNWANIEEAVSMYLQYTKSRDNRKPMRPSFYPVGLSDEGKIQNALAANGIDAFDFALWSADAQGKKTKRVAGEDLPSSAFAHVGDKNDPSTWKLPVKFKSPAKTASHAKNALSRINQTQGIPGSAKSGVLQKVRNVAKKHGVEVSETTPKQRKWAAQGV